MSDIDNEAAQLWRNRIIETKLVHADDIKEHPLNWRTHPQAQAEALEGVLEEVGIVDTLKCYYSERNGGALTLWDGALRRSRGGLWPVDILDINDAEADLLITVFDPISALAGANSDNLDALLQGISTGNEALQELFADIADKAGLYADEDVAASTPFSNFDEPLISGDFVGFKFGVYAGRVSQDVYADFVAAYKAQQLESGEPMLDDVLRSWLDV
jgi:hypothetical protein